jgi:hypothetical protein
MEQRHSTPKFWTLRHRRWMTSYMKLKPTKKTDFKSEKFTIQTCKIIQNSKIVIKIKSTSIL